MLCHSDVLPRIAYRRHHYQHRTTIAQRNHYHLFTTTIGVPVVLHVKRTHARTCTLLNFLYVHEGFTRYALNHRINAYTRNTPARVARMKMFDSVIVLVHACTSPLFLRYRPFTKRPAGEHRSDKNRTI